MVMRIMRLTTASWVSATPMCAADCRMEPGGTGPSGGRVLAVPGTGFGMPGYFRLTFCVDKKVIENAAEGFAKAIKG